MLLLGINPAEKHILKCIQRRMRGRHQTVGSFLYPTFHHTSASFPSFILHAFYKLAPWGLETVILQQQTKFCFPVQENSCLSLRNHNTAQENSYSVLIQRAEKTRAIYR